MKLVIVLIILLISFPSIGQIQINNQPSSSSPQKASTISYVDIYWNGTSPIKVLLNDESQFTKPKEKKRFKIDPNDGYNLKLQTTSEVYNYDLFLMFDKGENILIVDLVNGQVTVSEDFESFNNKHTETNDINNTEQQIVTHDESTHSEVKSLNEYQNSYSQSNSNFTTTLNSFSVAEKRSRLKNLYLSKVPHNPTDKTHQILKRENGSIQMVLPLMKNYEYNGSYFVYHENGNVMGVGEFAKNLINGKMASFDVDGNIIQVALYSESKLMEIEIAWDAEGNELHYPDFKNGNGSLQYYHPNGFMMGHYEYKNGVLGGITKVYYENGQLQSEIEYKEGLPYSIIQSYNEDGSYKDLGTLKNGNGTFKLYDANGKFLMESKYKNGQITF